MKKAIGICASLVLLFCMSNVVAVDIGKQHHKSRFLNSMALSSLEKEVGLKEKSEPIVLHDEINYQKLECQLVNSPLRLRALLYIGKIDISCNTGHKYTEY